MAEHHVVMALFEDVVAAKVIDAFNSFPGNGKPKKEGNSISEFTVLAAIVAETGVILSGGEVGSNLIVLSMATGTKCAGKGREDKHGYITTDSHAEVLARRGLVRWLSKCVAALQFHPTIISDPLFPLYEVKQSIGTNRKGLMLSEAPYAVKEDWHFYLYISDSPCGDGTLYPRTIEDCQVDGYTGAKLVRSDFTAVSLECHIPKLESAGTPTGSDSQTDTTSLGITAERNETGYCSWERENVQGLGLVRTKSGRSDIPMRNRTSSMSCSDKICR